MAEEDYEILPHQVLIDLKSQVEGLKKKLVQPDAKSEELILEIESLKDSIHELTVIFTKALEDLKDDDSSKAMRIITEKLQAVVSQNETIAQGMIAISDKLDAFMKDNGMASPAPMAPPSFASMQHTMGAPAMPGPARMAPRPVMSAPLMNDDAPADDMDAPPPPPRMNDSGKRKAISDAFR